MIIIMIIMIIIMITVMTVMIIIMIIFTMITHHDDNSSETKHAVVGQLTSGLRSLKVPSLSRSHYALVFHISLNMKMLDV